MQGYITTCLQMSYNAWAQELGVQIEEPFSIIAIESIFDSTQVRRGCLNLISAQPIEWTIEWAQPQLSCLFAHASDQTPPRPESPGGGFAGIDVSRDSLRARGIGTP
jgi:hypothetical protein